MILSNYVYQIKLISITKRDLFRLRCSCHYVMLPSVIEHVTLQSQSLCNNMALAYRGVQKNAPTNLGEGGAVPETILKKLPKLFVQKFTQAILCEMKKTKSAPNCIHNSKLNI